MTLPFEHRLKECTNDLRTQKRIIETQMGEPVEPSLLNIFEHWLLDDEQQFMLGLNPWNYYFLSILCYLMQAREKEPAIITDFQKTAGQFNVNHPEAMGRIRQFLSEVDHPDPDGRVDPVLFQGEAINAELIIAAVRLGQSLDLESLSTIRQMTDEYGVEKSVSAETILQRFQVKSSGPHPVLPGTIRVMIGCTDAHTHRMLKRWENRIQKMLHQLNRQVSPRFLFSDVLFEIHPEGYTPLDMKFSVDSTAALGLFTGNRLYSDRRVFLRELIQNAVDACNLKSIFKPDHVPEISVDLDMDDGVIHFTDNGIGMDRQWMEKYFLKIGISFYQSGDLKAVNRKNLDFNFISKFGIGFLSGFLVSEKIVIQTRKENAQGLIITISNLQEYFDVRPAEDDCPLGTRVSLYVGGEKNRFSRFMEYACYLKTNMRFLSLPVTLTDHRDQISQLGKETLAYDIEPYGHTEYRAKLDFKVSEGYLFLKAKQNLNRFYGLEYARGGVSIFQDGIFVTQTDLLLPEGARGSIIGRINLTGNERCELSMDRNRIFWTEAQLQGLKRLIRLGLVDLANQVMAEKKGLEPPWSIDNGLIQHLAIFFDFNDIDDDMYQGLAQPVRDIVAKRFRDFIRVHFAHSGDKRHVPDADGYAEHWQQRILDTFKKKSRPSLPSDK